MSDHSNSRGSHLEPRSVATQADDDELWATFDADLGVESRSPATDLRANGDTHWGIPVTAPEFPQLTQTPVIDVPSTHGPPSEHEQSSGANSFAGMASRSPRRQHRISHLIDSFRHLHVPHLHNHDHERPDGSDSFPVTPDSLAVPSPASIIVSGPSSGSSQAEPEKADKKEKRRSFRLSRDLDVSKPRKGRSPFRRVSLRSPAALGTSPPLPNHDHFDTPIDEGTSSSAPSDQSKGDKKNPNGNGRSEGSSGDDSSAHTASKTTDRAQQLDREAAKRERHAIKEVCKRLNVDIIEMETDGHCLYASVADQLNYLAQLNGPKGESASQLTYKNTRKACAENMCSDPDSFMPFISDSDERMAGIKNDVAGTAEGGDQSEFFLSYCDAVENTSIWGGQPEILAMARAYQTPIVVLQAGSDPLRFGEEFNKPPAYIAFYRAAYGLGEHYNSLRPQYDHLPAAQQPTH